MTNVHNAIAAKHFQMSVFILSNFCVNSIDAINLCVCGGTREDRAKRKCVKIRRKLAFKRLETGFVCAKI